MAAARPEPIAQNHSNLQCFVFAVRTVRGAGAQQQKEMPDSHHVYSVPLRRAHSCSPRTAAQDGRTALHVAAATGFLEVVKALLAAGADKEATDKVRMCAGCFNLHRHNHHQHQLMNSSAPFACHGRHKCGPGTILHFGCRAQMLIVVLPPAGVVYD